MESALPAGTRLGKWVLGDVLAHQPWSVVQTATYVAGDGIWSDAPDAWVVKYTALPAKPVKRAARRRAGSPTAAENAAIASSMLGVENMAYLRLRTLRTACPYLIRMAAPLNFNTTHGVQYMVLQRGGPDMKQLSAVSGQSRVGRTEYTGRIGVYAAAVVGSSVLSALQYLHAAGLVHRDIKSGNVIVGRGGPAEASKVYLIDLGSSLAVRAVDGTRNMNFDAGTPMFRARAACAGAPPSPVAPAQDLEAWLNLLLVLAGGQAALPWSTSLSTDDEYVLKVDDWEDGGMRMRERALVLPTLREEAGALWIPLIQAVANLPDTPTLSEHVYASLQARLAPWVSAAIPRHWPLHPVSTAADAAPVLRAAVLPPFARPPPVAPLSARLPPPTLGFPSTSPPTVEVPLPRHTEPVMSGVKRGQRPVTTIVEVKEDDDAVPSRSAPTLGFPLPLKRKPDRLTSPPTVRRNVTVGFPIPDRKEPVVSGIKRVERPDTIVEVEEDDDEVPWRSVRRRRTNSDVRIVENSGFTDAVAPRAQPARTARALGLGGSARGPSPPSPPPQQPSEGPCVVQ